MLFDDRYHMHAGYYKDGHDLEAVLFKVKNKDMWCMFFQNDLYQLNITEQSYPSVQNFGLLVGIYTINTNDLTEEKATELLEAFLKEQKLI
ncbi:hypothetical protein FIU87_19200 [Bacillus sp. THAF10]|uniref:DUF3986 family protein n=1 Tax=Bacillus sp. THAF10 TaxID=2587848 RepID=UPI001267FC69|nr:DUF3986 family protein [Bacillus sp. THAF10]QFT90776.1 hypothetical protein FIU87_19200 [Bacillus sp. THAF10]